LLATVVSWIELFLQMIYRALRKIIVGWYSSWHYKFTYTTKRKKKPLQNSERQTMSLLEMIWLSALGSLIIVNLLTIKCNDRIEAAMLWTLGICSFLWVWIAMNLLKAAPYIVY
jgi:hypothetical protein